MKKLMIFLSTLVSFALAYANQNIATVVRLSGDVQIFTHPSDKISGPAPHVLFEKKYYSVKRAKLGDKLLKGHIIQTGNNSKARVIFRNGDQIHIGEGTAYKIEWKKQTSAQKNHSVLNLIRGKFRAIISKKGPRNNLMIKSKQASLAIRGTDFYVHKIRDQLKLNVIRGKVELTAPLEKKMIAAGTSAIAHKKVTLYGTSQKELIQIHRDSIIKVKEEDKPRINQETATKIMDLEKAAVATTLEDIKTYDPKQFQQLQKQNITSISSLNSLVIKESFKKAPKDNQYKIDDFSEEEPYKKYFKID